MSKLSNDVGVAVRNLAKLGGSLGLTLLIGFVLRPFLRRWIGPEQFGPLDAADGITATFFVVLSLGVDGYARKEIPTRPQHGNDFFGSVMLLRTLLTLPIYVGMFLLLEVTNRPQDVRTLVWVLGAVQFVMALNTTFTTMLQANMTIDGLSVINVVGKVVWAVLAVLGAWLGYGVIAIALAQLVSEVLRAIVGWSLCRKHLKLSFANVGWLPVKAIVLSGLPFYLNTVFHSIYNKVDLFIVNVIASGRLGEAAGDKETAWYGAAAALGGMAFLVMPLVSGVVMPVLVRAKAKDPVEFDKLIKRTLELMLVVSIPISLAYFVGADVLIGLMFGPEYAPAAKTLGFLAPIYCVIYMSITSSLVLQIENRIWGLTVLSFVGLAVNLVGNYFLIGLFLDKLGPGGGGRGAAAMQVVTEAGVAIAMFVMVGRRSFDLRTVSTVVRTLIVCVACVFLDDWARDAFPQLPGLLRLMGVGVAYAVGVLAIRGVRVKELREFLKQAKAAKNEPVPMAATEA